MERSRLRAGFRIITGFVLILVGMIGWLLPVLPGWALIIAGLALLSRHFHWARRLKRHAQRYQYQLTRRWRRRKLSRKVSVDPA